MKSARKLELGDIVETIFINGLDKLSTDSREKLYNHLTDFCVDKHGAIRLGSGIVSSEDSNPNYVPSFRYKIRACHWTSHYDYVDIDLPNPANSIKEWSLIRGAFIKEIEKRLALDLRFK